MYTGKKTNEELVVAYRDTKDERYLEALIRQNKGLLYMIVEPFVHSIPNSELEDLTSEAYIPMLRAIDDFDEDRGLTFSNLLKVYVRQHLSRLYNEARVCYKSTDKITEGSAEKMIRSLIKNNHDAMLEHYSFSVSFICDRGISHEIVRHRIASFAQESTRYCNYGSKDGEITVIEPFYLLVDGCLLYTSPSPRD